MTKKLVKLNRAKTLYLYDRKIEGQDILPRTMTQTKRNMEKPPIQSEDCVG